MEITYNPDGSVSITLPQEKWTSFYDVLEVVEGDVEDCVDEASEGSVEDYQSDIDTYYDVKKMVAEAAGYQ